MQLILLRASMDDIGLRMRRIIRELSLQSMDSDSGCSEPPLHLHPHSDYNARDNSCGSELQLDPGTCVIVCWAAVIHSARSQSNTRFPTTYMYFITLAIRKYLKANGSINLFKIKTPVIVRHRIVYMYFSAT